MQSYVSLDIRTKLSARRNGATMVESAIVLPIIFLIIFALLDLGLAAVRYNTLAEVSRLIARSVTIHGSLAPESQGVWGPNEYTGTIADSAEIVGAAKDLTPTMEPDKIAVRVIWLDNDNSPRDRVRVAVRYLHEPLVPTFFAWGPLDLNSVTTMRIVN